MKILHMISGGDTGGAKTHILSLMKGLKGKAYAKVVCFIRDSFYEDLKNEGVNIEVFEQKNRSDLSVLEEILKIIKKDNVDIVHSHGARANFLSVFLKNKVDIPFITTIHSDYELDFKDNFYKKVIFTNLNKFALKKFDYYITVSDDFNDMMQKRGFSKEKLFTVYNGIDINKERGFLSKEEFLNLNNIKGRPTIFGISARLDLVKDHETFLRAVERANKKNKNILYLIAGDGNQRENIERIIKEKKLENVYLLGFQRDIFSFYNAIDVNVLTSKSESFPYSLLEGGILKKPVISTDVGGISKLIDKDTGYLFEVGDDERLSEIFLELSEHSETIESMGENIKIKIEEKFSSNSMADSHIDIYSKIINAKKVLMLGYYGYDNSGDDAILGAIVKDLKNFNGSLKITAMSGNPEKTRNEYSINAINRFDILKVRKAMRETDLFIFGGGTLLQDRTSTRSIRYYLYILELAKKYQRKTIVYANGMGPINGDKNRYLTKKALEEVDIITLRDNDSYEFLRELGLERDIISLTDPVFSLEGGNVEKNPKTLAISVRDWSNRDKIIKEFRKFIELVIENTDWKIIIFPMQYPKDIDISRKIGEGFNKRVSLYEENFSVSEIIDLLSGVEITIGMRLHSLIYSAISLTPMIGISYDPKIDGLLRELEMKPPINTEEILGEELYKEFIELAERIPIEREKLQRLVGDKRELAKENAKIALKLLG